MNEPDKNTEAILKSLIPVEAGDPSHAELMFAMGRAAGRAEIDSDPASTPRSSLSVRVWQFATAASLLIAATLAFFALQENGNGSELAETDESQPQILSPTTDTPKVDRETLEQKTLAYPTFLSDMGFAIDAHSVLGRRNELLSATTRSTDIEQTFAGYDSSTIRTRSAETREPFVNSVLTVRRMLEDNTF